MTTKRKTKSENERLEWIEERQEDTTKALREINNTLTNHMNEYKHNFEVLEANTSGSFDLMNERIATLSSTLWRVVGILSALLFLVISALIGVAVAQIWRL